ncbi:lipoprotein, SmpA/OmlA family [Ketogulonicigenium robustum]|uniref:Lipoprotein, SmpA/OmlA family n=1 Tax=Ketogulonicigenium robustum TaxID=92947 RepID=A0A1W6NZ51_9RHOB|nr:outer membrane protein assembly factor BamE [Ketogulonicigenium robustum]ARO14536.1 lipoprotein, SmpA/OmlA family [Ketogulonicigenium robustum]
MEIEISQRRKVKAGLMRSMRIALAAGALVATVACVPMYRNHGYVPTDEMVSALTVGRDTRASVIAAIGEPAAQSVQNAAAFYYVQSRFETYGAFAPREIDRQVLAVTFDNAGVVRNITRYGLADGNVVTLSRRVTDDLGDDATFVRQLLGNFGRVNAASMLGEE